MFQPHRNDSQMVGHARRELEIAGLFTKSEENNYDGFIGRGVLSLVKLFEQWTGDDPSKMQAIQSVFNYVITGDLLSPPTNDPDEWEDFEVEDKLVRRNKRNIFYITEDDAKTWRNLRNGQKGICNDHKTGKPLEGVEDPNGTPEQTAKDQESSTDAGDAGHGKNAQSAIKAKNSTAQDDNEQAGPSRSSKSGGEVDKPVEDGELNAGMEPQSIENKGQAEAGTEESKSGEA